MSEGKAEYRAGKAKSIQAIEIRAELRQVKTMVDHSFNVVLNLPEECLPQVQTLLGWLGNELHAVLETV